MSSERALDAPVADLLLEEQPRDGESLRRFRPFDLPTVDQLVRLGTFDCLVAAILYIEKSERIASPELRELAFRCYLGLQDPVGQLAEVRPWAAELFRTIDTTCKHWVFPRTNARMDIVFFTDEVRRLADGGPEATDAVEERCDS